MKYFIVSIFKFIWGLILTICWLIYRPIVFILHLLWYFEFLEFEYWFWYVSHDFNISPYYITHRGYNYCDHSIFKSYFQYIWNLK